MTINVSIADDEICESVTRALNTKLRRLLVVDWVVRDLTDDLPFRAGCRASMLAKHDNFRPLVKAHIEGRLCNEAFDANLSEKEKKAIEEGRAILSSDGGKYHAVSV